ncbi:phosphosulfolactate synthase [Bacillus sp. BRMEA1]|uniref:phosphosulfolactate synthase n=1 Tax=Neobacillus endophyticus TaxID=2738405 RepID=UPI001564DD1E|nr:phosphosulfolactate synthase [Neobacillus endophyticus]NRD79218.1 phosphosulfolactate synthase [Neobacillus endophyticus]
MEFLSLPQRTSGNRTYGLTSIADFGTPLGELKNILTDYHHIIDIAKIGIGTAYVTPNLHKKVDLYKEYDIKPYCGGTLFEKCYHQNKIHEYITYLHGLGIEWVEVSSGTLDIPIKERLQLISFLKNHFHVMAEVGSKDTNKLMSIDEWRSEIQQLLEAGCDYVITEGRDSGTSGIYEQNGEVKCELIYSLCQDVDVNKIIFEAPSPKQQMYFIKEVGPNVNLGNVKVHDVLTLEAQRCGLRCETFFLEEQECKLP